MRRVGVARFNAWWFTSECDSVLPTLAGPVFSYPVMLAGVVIARKNASPRRWVGVALLFAANPFARSFTAVMGGGDEMVVGRRLAGVAQTTVAVRVVVLLVVGSICAAFVVGNGLLRAGVLAEPVIAGAPLLVLLVTAVVFVMTGLTAKRLSIE